MAVSETVKEIKFLANLLDVMKIVYQRPIKVNIDNVGALFLVRNRNTMMKSETERIRKRRQHSKKRNTEIRYENIARMRFAVKNDDEEQGRDSEEQSRRDRKGTRRRDSP